MGAFIPGPAPSPKPLPLFLSSDQVWPAAVLGACILIASLIWTFDPRPVGRYHLYGNLSGLWVVDTATGQVERH